MELFNLEDIALDDVTEDLLRDVHRTACRVNELRPLPPVVIQKVQHELLGERVFSSNAIEGNTYDLRETREILKTGHIVDPARKREGKEVVNLGKAIEYIQTDLLKTDCPHTVERFLSMHKTLLREIEDDWAGRFRDKDVKITGAKHRPPEHRFVPGLVDRFLERLDGAGEVDTILLAVWAHWTIASIHPFRDGNGRMARLWQDLILFKGGLTCAIIPPQDRSEYLSSLEAADEGDFNPLTQLIAQRVASTLDKFLTAQREAEELTEWAEELVGEAGTRAAEKRKLTYIRWSRKMEQLRYAFQLCASRIAQIATDIDVQLRPYDIIDQGRWENLASGLAAAKTWFFTLSFRRDRRYLRYFFFFGWHLPSSDAVVEFGGLEARVCLLISEQEAGQEEARRLDEIADTPMSIRELFLADDALVRKRYDPIEEKEVHDERIEATLVAQEFIRDVLLLRLG